MKGKYARKSDRSKNTRKIILWAVVILKLVNEVVKLVKNIFD